MKVNHEKATQLWELGKVDKEIAIEMGCCAALVCDWRRKNKLPSNVGIFNWDKDGYVDKEKKSYSKYG